MAQIQSTPQCPQCLKLGYYFQDLIKNSDIGMVKAIYHMLIRDEIYSHIRFSPYIFYTAANAHIGTMHPIKLIDKFIVRSKPYWGEISNHNLDFFKTDGLTLFDSVDKSYVDDFTKVIFSGNLTSKDLRVLWNYLDRMVEVSLEYINHSNTHNDKFKSDDF